ncbi:putative calcium transporter [Cladorrhinum sp. PSN332]|nr:putative calcium transporter [Cladorrhinum sp. PSN332]
MHHIRRWGRPKAPDPLRLPSISSPPASSSTSMQDRDLNEPKNDQDLETISPTISERPPEKRNIGSRFVAAVVNILLSSWLNVFLLFVPAGIVVRLMHAPAGVVFLLNAIAIVPLAGLLSHATESVASTMGDTIGALMNVTFGNAVELIIFIIALIKNQIRIVQASLVGSILANVLLILGMCFLMGGLKFEQQAYNNKVTHTSASLLALSVMSLLIPTVFHASFSKVITADDKVLKISRGTSIILLVVYLLYLVFQLKTHTGLYESTAQHIIDEVSRPGPAAQIFHASNAQGTSGEDEEVEPNDSGTPRRARRGRPLQRRGTDTSDETAIVSSTGTEGTSSVRAETPASGSADSPARAPSNSDEEALHEPSSAAPPKNASKKSTKRPTKSLCQCSQPRRGVTNFDLEAQQQLPPTLPPVPPPGRPLSLSLTFRTMPFSAPNLPPSRRPSVIAASAAAPQRRPSIIPASPAPSCPSPTNRKARSPTSRTSATVLLLLSTTLVSLHAEFMVSSIDAMLASDAGLSEAFIGLILLPIVGNAAEHVTAVSVALKNKMDLAIGVAVGSSIQIALFVTPLVVLLGWIMGKEMSLFFTLFETVCVVVSAFIVSFLVLDGRSNYLEGALLCAGYVIIAVAAYFYPDAGAANSLGSGMEIGGST